MKYTVSINEAKRSITVTLADGTKGVAKCCPTDRFDINTGIELALERAKVAQATTIKEKESKTNPMATQMTVTMLIKQLEKALPKGQMVVVGNGDKMTEAHKAWLRSLIGGCSCSCCEDEYEVDDAYESGYNDGYADGYANAAADYEDEECEDCERYSDAMHRIVEILDEVGVID